ncbi:hypothetical protein JL12_00920 [Gallibacterium anatis 10672-6]|uniref:polysaccharide pyruvyl transferase family protein n=1 Tax=Gallibacterium anatis TaxID=750 RepID=UPI000531A853|nr:polysaccharide pyruvyl transferase family protein [Gallibacterium anatis]KGQ52460.1 hypothetical protein JL12_00920 [Gallibacterium anatis 10672-6]
MRKKIVISGWYGSGNIGDEAILQAIIDIFNKDFPNCEITVLSFNPSYTKYTQQIDAVRQFPSSIKGWVRSIFTLNIVYTIRAIKNCDLFVMGGGGFLSDWQPEVPGDWLKQMKVAKFFGKETWLYRIGAGPFLSEKGKNITRYYIDNFVDRIVVRDNESYRQLKNNVRIRKLIDIEIDPVAELNVDRYINKDEQEDNSISLIYTEYFKNKNFDKEQHKKWDVLFSAFCSQIEAVLQQGYVAKLVFFQRNIEKELADKFVQVFGSRVKLEFPKDYKEAIKIMNRSIAIISFRLHGNILAYAMKKQFLPIIYHHKAAGFLKHINYPYLDCILEVGDGKNWRNEEILPQNWFNKTNSFLEKIKNNKKII